jgi:hypothetical protein
VRLTYTEGASLLVSLTMTGSFVLLFGTAGLVLDVAGAMLGPLLPWLSIGIGVVLVLAAGRLIAGGRSARSLRSVSPIRSAQRRVRLACEATLRMDSPLR